MKMINTDNSMTVFCEVSIRYGFFYGSHLNPLTHDIDTHNLQIFYTLISLDITQYLTFSYKLPSTSHYNSTICLILVASLDYWT